MTRLDIGLLSIAVTVALMVIRVPIGVAMVSVSFVGISLAVSFDAAWGMLGSIPYAFIASWELSAVPMFLMMGYIAASAGLTHGLFVAMRLLFGWLPGSLAVASVGAAALFAAACGSSPAASAALSRIAVPEMLKSGYDKALATGTIAAAGTLGSLIPPSIIMVIYGVFTNTPVGPLFMAGILPGILTAFAFSVMLIVRVMFKPSLAPRSDAVLSHAEKRAALRDLWPLPTLIMGVMGGIMMGVFSPTEAGAVGAFLAIIIGALRRSLSLPMIWQALVDTSKATAIIFFVALGAALFQRLMAVSQIPTYFSSSILAFSDNLYVALALIAVLYLVLGMFLDSIGIMLLTLPVIMPLLTTLNVDFIWFGIIVVKLLEMGLVTPPLGINVFVVKSSLGKLVDLQTVFRGVTWFVATDAVVLLILIAFPIISLYLPALLS